MCLLRKTTYVIILVISLAVITSFILLPMQASNTPQHEFLNPAIFTITDAIDDDPFVGNPEQECEITLLSTQYPIVINDVYFSVTEGSSGTQMGTGESITFKNIKVNDPSAGDSTVFVATDTTGTPNSILLESGDDAGIAIQRSLKSMPELVDDIAGIDSKEFDTTTTLGFLFPYPTQGDFKLLIALDLDADTTTDGFDLTMVFIVEAPETATLNASESCS